MKRVYRSRRTKVIGGVAAGLAEYFDVDITLMRLIFALAAIVLPHIMILGYILAWVIIPEEPFTALTDGSPVGSPVGSVGVSESQAGSRVSEGSSSAESQKSDQGSSDPGADRGLTADEILSGKGTTGTGQAAPGVPGAGGGAKAQEPGVYKRPEPVQAKREDDHRDESSQRSRQFFGYMLVALGAFLLLRRVVPPFWLDMPMHMMRVWWPLGLVGLGLILVLSAVRGGRR